MAKTEIEWATDSWNPVTGCAPVSTGCQNCYARRMAHRLRGRYGYPQDDPFKVTLHPDRLDQPLHWRKPRMIFCCSMGDLFHKDVPDSFIDESGRTVAKCPQHKFLILTKRPERMMLYFKKVRYEIATNPPHEDLNMPNVYIGVSIEDQPTADERIPILLQVPAAVRVISIEPMLGPIDLRKHIDSFFVSETAQSMMEPPRDTYIRQPSPIQWVICGPEAGSKRRPCELQWIRAVKDQCVEAGVPFFLKALYENGKKVSMPVLDGRVWDEFPKV